jgi:ubiquitin-conjugating enzyme E2 S
MEEVCVVFAGFFLTKIFHPNVASNGAICVNTLKRDWKPEHGIRHILLVMLQHRSVPL